MCLLYPSRPYLGFPTLAPSYPLVSRSFDRAAALLGSARLICRLGRAGTEGKSNISPTTYPVRLVRFPMSIHHIAPLVRTAWRLPELAYHQKKDRSDERRCLEMEAASSCAFSYKHPPLPSCLQLSSNVDSLGRVRGSTATVCRHFGGPPFFLVSPGRVSSITRGPVRHLHHTHSTTPPPPPSSHLLPPSCQDGFRCAEQRAPALDVKHLSTNHLHLGASLPGTGISVFRRAQRASRLPCSPPPRYPSFSVLPNWPYTLFSLIPSLPVAVHPRPRRTPID